jgi:hypothetical protein
VLTANRCRLSGDSASGRTCPLSNSVNEEPAADAEGDEAGEAGEADSE